VSAVERLLPWACLLAALVLAVSELQTMFELTPAGGEPLAEQSGGDRHGYAILVLAVFAAASTAFAVFAASRPAAIAVAVMGVVALLIFLLLDLPDVGRTGLLEDERRSFVDAEAQPQGGFWLLLIGALGLTLSGVALATLSAEQLAALWPRRREREARPRSRSAGNEDGGRVGRKRPRGARSGRSRDGS
jgi:uncharacterized MnhB-related membrane protein